MTDKELTRRRSLLATIYFWSLISVLQLRQEMESVHGIAMSADLVRVDLDWLAEMGLVRWNGEAAQLTERGRDIAMGRAKLPGEA